MTTRSLALMTTLLVIVGLAVACTERRAKNPTITSSTTVGSTTSTGSPSSRTDRDIQGAPDRPTAGYRKTVPRNTELVVRLADRISTSTNRSGDRFTATLENDLYVGNDLVAPRGSLVHGTLTQVEEAGRVEGNARLTMTLADIVANRQNYRIVTNSLTVKAEDSVKEDALKIGGGAGLGAIIGAIAGGGKGAAVGAAVGAAAGTGVVLATKGNRVEFDPEQRFAFYLQEPVRMQVLR